MYKWFDKKRNRWYIRFKKENGGLTTTTLANYLWKQAGYEVPEKYNVWYKDGNPENCVLENLYVVSRSELNSTLLLGHVVSDETREKIGQSNSGKIRTSDTRNNFSKVMKLRWSNGEFDNQRKSDASRVRLYKTSLSKLSVTIRERDNDQCQICGKDVSNGRLGHIHHIDGTKTNDIDTNLVLLCNSCHKLVHVPESDKERNFRRFRSKLI